MNENLKELYTTDKITINGNTIGIRETTVLIELVIGAIEHGVQNSSFLEETCGINKIEQQNTVEELERLFSRNMEPVGDEKQRT